MTLSTSKIWAIVPAAGQGKRFSEDKPKQFYELNGQLIAEHTLSRLLRVSQIQAIIIPSNNSLEWSNVPSFKDGKVHRVNGGEQRAHSVLNGLVALQGKALDDDWVFIHDMARPCITLSDIEKLIITLDNYPIGGILAARVNETLKQIGSDNNILSTVDRSQYRLAQTPQMFRYKLLKDAICASFEAKIIPTDEASAIEQAGLEILCVDGRHDNIKITRQEDLPIASAIMKKQEVDQCV